MATAAPWRLLVVLLVLLGSAGCRGGADLTSAEPIAAIRPAAHDFGLVGLHRPVLTAVELGNEGRAPLALLDARVEGAGAGDYALRTSPGATVTTGASLPIHVQFRPSLEGVRPATLVLETNAPGEPELRIALQGEGLSAAAVLSIDRIEFGHIEVGAHRPLAMTVTNPSDLPITVGASSGGRDGEAFGAGGPTTLAPKQSVSWAAWFDPQRSGDASATLAFAPCEGCDPLSLPLHGTGIDHALVFAPDSVDFGALDVDRIARRSITLTNQSDMAVQLRGLAIADGSDPGFVLEAGALPLPTDLVAHQSITRRLDFVAVHLGPAVGGLELRSSSPRFPRVVVPLLGTGGGPEIGVSTDHLDFGDVAVGVSTGKRVRIQNNGGSAVDLVIQSIAVLGDSSSSSSSTSSFSAAAPVPLPTLRAGEFYDLDVEFAPAAVGTFSGRLAIASNDGASPEVDVALAGAGVPIASCSLRVSPTVLDFGALPPSTGKVLGFKAENRGAEVCVLTNFGFDDSASGAFVLYGAQDTRYEIWPGESMVRNIGFVGASLLGDYRGLIGFDAPGHARYEVALTATVSDAVCLQAVPDRLDWGTVRGVCGVAPRSLQVINTCAAPVTVAAVRVSAGTDPEFDLSAPLLAALPATIAPNASLVVTVAYRAQVPGEVAASVEVETTNLPDPVVAPLFANNVAPGPVDDLFVQQAPGQLDVLMVIDNSVSMQVNESRLRAAAPQMASALIGAGLDVHLGVTSTGIDPVAGGGCPGGAGGGEGGRLFPVDGSMPRVLTASTPQLAQQLASNLSVGTCHYLEEPLEAARRALSPPVVNGTGRGNAGFYRPAAALAVVFLDMEDDHSPSNLADYVKFLHQLKGATTPERLSVVTVAPVGSGCALAGSSDAPRLVSVTQQLVGAVYDICTADLGAAFSSAVNLSAQPRTAFTLTKLPGSGAALQVSVDGVAQTTGWSFDAPTNRVVFAGSSVPAPGSVVEVRYTPCN